MNETLEQILRDDFADRAASYDTDDAVERLRAFAGRQRSRRRFVWPAIGVGGTTLTGGIVTAILLLSTGTPAAYAGWTAVPTTPTPHAIATAASSCERRAAEDTHPFTARPVLTEQRGRHTTVVAIGDGRFYFCITGEGPGSSRSGSLRSYPSPGANQIDAPFTESTSQDYFAGGTAATKQFIQLVHDLTRTRFDQRAHEHALRQLREFTQAHKRVRDAEGNALGRAGSNVFGVTLVLSNGLSVQATIQNGWYFAWWPTQNTPTSVTVRTRSGTITSHLSGQDPQCQQDSPCVFAGTGQRG